MKVSMRLLCIALPGLLTGCARFDPQPLSAEKTAATFESRTLDNADLKVFLQHNLTHQPAHWPPTPWDFPTLTLVAFYYHPSLAVARAQWEAAEAGIKTAGGRPNPTVSVTPGYDSQIPGTPSPWIVPVTFDLPIETAGKRKRRIEQAQSLSASARLNIAAAAWQVRAGLRAAMLDLYAARQSESLLARQEAAQSNVTRLLQNQYESGNISAYEVTQARIASDTTRLALQQAHRQSAEALASLADAIGLTTHALENVQFSFDELNHFPTALTAPEVRTRAILHRTDVLGALADYAASQSALQLEIAKQLPDVHLGPGYAWNTGSTGDNEWQLGLSVELPILNQNQGPIAEAKARRAVAAAQFLAVQAKAIGAIDRALAGYHAALAQSETASTLLDNLDGQMKAARASQAAGETDALAVANATVEYNTGALSRLDALVKAQEALGQLEDAMQSPVILPDSLLHNIQTTSDQTKPHSQHEL